MIKIYAVGLGPGATDLLSPRARAVLENCDTIAGYTTYLKQFPELFAGKNIISSGMRGEIERCKHALDAARSGKTVAVISSGDAGIYAMAGLLLELTEQEQYTDIEVETIPGITAASAAAALLGAPLMNDFAVISLSNLMTPDTVILQRLRGVAAAGMVCALYNPGSIKRKTLIREAVDIFIEAQGAATLVGIVHDASRPEERSQVTTLGEFPFSDINMTTLVIIGNDQTVYRHHKLYNLRGYSEKYGK
ncbi:MAG: precorrin-3B C(17)-methyltransferase [Victivallaceae bacterium]|nr:precorrin-3B C(17)-methyltransferase [Victivallaceae bacterium]